MDEQEMLQQIKALQMEYLTATQIKEIFGDLPS